MAERPDTADTAHEADGRSHDEGAAAPRERVVVALAGGPEAEALVRRAAAIARRAGGAELLAVHVAPSEGRRSRGPDGSAPGRFRRLRTMVERAGGTYHQVVGDDVVGAVVDFAQGAGATQLVVGSGRRGRWRWLRPEIAVRVAQAADRRDGGIDVHLVAHPYQRSGGGTGARAARGRLGRRRWIAGWLLALLGPPLLASVLAQEHRHLSLPTDLLLFLTLTVAVALVGGLGPAVVAAVAGFLLLNWFFTAPFHTFTVARPENTLALAVFVAVAVAVASVVDLAARRTGQAARASAEAETLSLLATSVLRGQEALPALLQRVRETFGVMSVSLLERPAATAPDDDGYYSDSDYSDGDYYDGDAAIGHQAGRPPPGRRQWVVMGSTGPHPCIRPEDADALASVREDPDGEVVLALGGRVLPATDRRVLSAFAAQAAAALEWRRLAEQAAQARRLAEGNKIRTALLAAVSHDLRTPLASIKAAVSSLRQDDVEWAPEDQAELLATIEESADRLGGLIADLLDMSRLQTGAVAPLARPVSVEEVLPQSLPAAAPGRIQVDVPETLPQVVADPGLLERALANVLENAVHHTGAPVSVVAEEVRFGRRPGRVEIRVADRGPGVADADKEAIFAPFQRLGDAPKGAGVGLGLAVARGFVEMMGGTLLARDTPGGGLTMVFSLPIALPIDATGGDDGPDGGGGEDGGSGVQRGTSE